MNQMTIDEVLVWLEEVRREYGGDVPLWLAHQDCGITLPVWARITTLVPVEALHLSSSAGHLTVCLLGLGTRLPEPSLTVDLDPDVVAQSTRRCLGCGCTAHQPCPGGCMLTVVPEVWCTQCVQDIDARQGATDDEAPCPYCGEEACEDSCTAAQIARAIRPREA